MRLKASRSFQKLVHTGRLGSLVTSVGLTTTLAKALDDPAVLKDSTGSLLGAVGNTSDFGKLLDLGNLRQAEKFSELTKLGKGLKILEFAGPIGDIVNLGGDLDKLSAEQAAGDKVGEYTSYASVAAGGAGFVAGMCVLAGVTGPFAPAVALIGTGVGLLSWGIDKIFGESEEESFLRRAVVIDGSERNYWNG